MEGRTSRKPQRFKRWCQNLKFHASWVARLNLFELNWDKKLRRWLWWFNQERHSDVSPCRHFYVDVTRALLFSLRNSISSPFPQNLNVLRASLFTSCYVSWKKGGGYRTSLLGQTSTRDGLGRKTCSTRVDLSRDLLQQSIERWPCSSVLLLFLYSCEIKNSLGQDA